MDSERLVDLGLLVVGGHALHAQADGNPQRGVPVQGEGQQGGGGDAGAELVVEEPGHAQDRVAQAGGAQEPLVGDALLIEGQDVGDGRPHVEER